MAVHWGPRSKHRDWGAVLGNISAPVLLASFSSPSGSWLLPRLLTGQRHRGTENIKVRSPQSLQKPKLQAPTRARRATVSAEPEPEHSALSTHAQPRAHSPGEGRREADQAPLEEQGKVPGAAQRAAWKSPEKEKIMVNTQSPTGQDAGTLAQSWKSQERKMTQGDGGQAGKLMATKTVSVKHQGKAAATAKALIPKGWHRMLAPTGAVPTRTRQKGVTAAVIPPKEKKAQVTPPPAPFQSPTTQGILRLKAANFKSEPRWDFEEKYSFEIGGLQTVSFCHHPFPLAPSSEAPPETQPSPPSPHLLGSASRLCLVLPQAHLEAQLSPT
ncbi:Alpha-N-acetylgalactosaminide alpha-2,6-sialyltransferase 1 [Saguinus oedipus]|uniref:Alpha-N-acetylgalactosaminide alpha-2,6-sialyltransferase 1 n=1 Tax=Saguinus oedipus TaxID=9490 RepID=A0ABQ9VRX0_SAGOE|nr:Alpha-N-acetylgalactosaminide alpha-2,6-sialyltransferase 1 [Saguinus oedipus]